MADVSLLGKNSILFLYVNTAYLPIGCLTSNDLSKSLEMNDGTATKCNVSPDPIPGKKSYQWSFEAVAIEDDVAKASLDKAHTLMDAGDIVYWKQEITKENNTKITRYGKGVLTELNESAPVEGEITFSGTIVGIGSVSATDLVTTTTTTTTV